ncbi:hypothetical protein ACFL2Y_05370, partial [Candidatus Omnitrophota bacterium]
LKPTYDTYLKLGLFRISYTGIPTGMVMSWYSMATMQLMTYLDASLSAYKAVQSSAAIAHTTAMGAMNIEEAQRRRGSPTGERVKSNFAIWMDGLDFYNDTRHDITTELTYPWFSYEHNFTQGGQVQPDLGNYARAEEVSTKVQKPDENSLELVPHSPLPLITSYFAFAMGFPPIHICCVGPDPIPYMLTGQVCSGYSMIVESVVSIAMGEILMATVLGWALYNDIWSDDAPQGMQNIRDNIERAMIAPVVGWIQPWFIQILCPVPMGPPTPCMCLYFNAGAFTYLVPVPWIDEIKSGDAGVKVEVSRFSPTKDLGLWQFRHGNITSGAWAKMHSGNVNKHPGGYKVRARKVWDGKEL